MEPWLNVWQIAKHLGVSKETIYRHIYRGEIPRYRLGKKYLFKASHVDAWILRSKRVPIPKRLRRKK